MQRRMQDNNVYLLILIELECCMWKKLDKERN